MEPLSEFGLNKKLSPIWNVKIYFSHKSLYDWFQERDMCKPVFKLEVTAHGIIESFSEFGLKKKWSPIWSVKTSLFQKRYGELIWLISRERFLIGFKVDFYDACHNGAPLWKRSDFRFFRFEAWLYDWSLEWDLCELGFKPDFREHVIMELLSEKEVISDLKRENQFLSKEIQEPKLIKKKIKFSSVSRSYMRRAS